MAKLKRKQWTKYLFYEENSLVRSTPGVNQTNLWFSSFFMFIIEKKENNVCNIKRPSLKAKKTEEYPIYEENSLVGSTPYFCVKKF